MLLGYLVEFCFWYLVVMINSILGGIEEKGIKSYNIYDVSLWQQLY